MDGPMRPYLPELTIRDYNIYQWYLRGVQYQLNTTYGLYSCSLLQHNGVLLCCSRLHEVIQDVHAAQGNIEMRLTFRRNRSHKTTYPIFAKHPFFSKIRT